MMEWTDRHCRYFHRLMTSNTLLYTEMITSAALIRGNAVHLLDYNIAEQPLALQLGGSDPRELSEAASLGEDRGYTEVNLNIGKHKKTVYGNDLNNEYISINADYRS